jgi:hypothetical protein
MMNFPLPYSDVSRGALIVGHFFSRYECADMRSITAAVRAARALATFLIRADYASLPGAAASTDADPDPAPRLVTSKVGCGRR